MELEIGVLFQLMRINCSIKQLMSTTYFWQFMDENGIYKKTLLEPGFQK